MAGRTWLIFDANNLAWRAFHTTGGLRNDAGPTGVVFGVLREVMACKAKFLTDDVAVCFDKGKSIRSKLHPWYKATRRKRKMTDEEEAARQGVQDQIDALRTEVFPACGCPNVFAHDGYEADDLMASCVLNLPKGDRACLVTGDQDLYQLISDRVCVWHPAQKTQVTRKEFVSKYGVQPRQWPLVKAIAGCSSDDVDGVPGVGELTACRYLAREAVPKTKAARIAESRALISKNLTIVKLPYKNTPPCELEPCAGEPWRWNQVADGLGFASLTRR